jgi:hypothetical protein
MEIDEIASGSFVGGYFSATRSDPKSACSLESRDDGFGVIISPVWFLAVIGLR